MKTFDVEGTSMWPVLQSGDTVIVDTTRAPKPGDLVAREIDGVAIVHRYVEKGITKGDRFSQEDPAFEDEANTMTVIGVIPRGERKVVMPVLKSLNTVQTFVSGWQGRQTSRALKRAALAVLIANGFLIRGSYILSARGNRNVVWKFERD